MTEPRLPLGPAGGSQWTPVSAEGASAYGNSTPAAVAGAILLIFALLVTFGAAIVLLSSQMLDRLLPAGREADAFRNIITGASAAFLAAGIVQLLAGIGILRHRSWARYLGIPISALWCALGVVTLFGSFAARETIPASGTTTDPSSGIAPGLALLVIYGFVLIALLIGGRHFERRQTT